MFALKIEQLHCLVGLNGQRLCSSSSLSQYDITTPDDLTAPDGRSAPDDLTALDDRKAADGLSAPDDLSYPNLNK